MATKSVSVSGGKGRLNVACPLHSITVLLESKIATYQLLDLIERLSQLETRLRIDLCSSPFPSPVEKSTLGRATSILGAMGLAMTCANSSP